MIVTSVPAVIGFAPLCPWNVRIAKTSSSRVNSRYAMTWYVTLLLGSCIDDMMVGVLLMGRSCLEKVMRVESIAYHAGMSRLFRLAHAVLLRCFDKSMMASGAGWAALNQTGVSNGL